MPRKAIRLLFAAAGCAVALAALLIAAYSVGPVERADATALDGLRSVSEENRWLWHIGDAFAHSVDLPFLVLGVVLIAFAGLRLGRRRQAIAAVSLIVVANVLTQAIKMAAAHPRYQAVLEPHQLSTEAFPSGHATAALSLALAAVLVAPGHRRPVVAAIGGGVALAVSVSLMLQGWHFPSDVLGAVMVVGMVSCLVAAALVASGAEPAEQKGLGRAWLRSAGAIAAEVALLGLAGIAVVVVVTHPGAVGSYVADHPSAVVAAIGVALASLGLVSGLATELETS